MSRKLKLSALRRRTEAQLEVPGPCPPPADDPQRLQHDLQVHQIELELQNQELRTAHAKLDAALTRHTEFYDFAPVGFLSLQPDGTITHANRTAASLLGVPASRLLQRHFEVFVPTASRVAFASLLIRTFESETAKTAELPLRVANQSPRMFLLQACRSADGLESRLVLTDISELRRAEAVLQARLRLSEFALGHSLDPLLTRTLDEAELLTGSTIGFFHFVEADQKTLVLQAWSTNTVRRMCAAEGKGRHYPADQAGVWAEALRERRPVIHNDYASLPQRKGLPPGHTPIVRELVIPVLRNERVVALLGVGNKPTEYEPHEIESVSELASLAWDIVFAKQAEEALRHSQALLLSLTESASDAIYAKDTEGRYVLFNAAARRFVGKLVEKVLGQDDTALFLPEEAQRLMEDDRRAMASTVQTYDEFLTTADGVVRAFMATKGPLRDAHGKVIGMFGISRDITERKEAETALRASEVRYRGLFESAKDGILILDAETGMVLDVNPFLIELLGFSHETFLGKKVWELGFFKDLLANQNNFAELQQKEYLRYEDLALETHDGRRIQVEFISSLYRVDHQKVIQCSIRDITARKQLQEANTRLATAVEQAGESIMITDTRGLILYVNPAFEKVSGYSRAEALGQSPRLIKSGKHEAPFYRQMWAVLERGETWSGHLINQHKDGKLFEEDATISPIRDSQGRTINYVAVKHDVTRELQLEAQYRQAQKIEAIGQLAGGIAHDFNNILAAILGNVQMAVVDTDLSHPARESLDEIRKASFRAKSLVEQILTFSRQQPQDRQVIALDPIIDEAVKFLRATIPSGVEIATVIATGVPHVLADATQIYQVVFNLCTNAWHALEERPGRISIQLQAVTLDAAAASHFASLRPGRFACLTVSDTGKGMDAATIERIFDPFFTTKEVGKGTGLGLSVVRGIIENHEGAITVESQPGRGTTFQVYFFADVVATLAAERSPIAQTHQGQGQHVLFLDDEEALARLVTRMLKRLGYRVTSFTRAEDAIKAFRANPGQFDVVITDMNMPGASGLDVARELLTVRPDVPVVLCSGRVTPQLTDQARSMGIRHVLYKPSTIEEFSETLRQVITEPRQP